MTKTKYFEIKVLQGNENKKTTISLPLYVAKTTIDSSGCDYIVLILTVS
jgi:hypothetical protein